MNNARNTQLNSKAVMTDGRSHGFRQAKDKTLAILPTGYTLEIFRRPDGETQCVWLPKRPDFKQRAVREAVLPHYDTAIRAFASTFGKPVWVHGSAYESGVMVGS